MREHPLDGVRGWGPVTAVSARSLLHHWSSGLPSRSAQTLKVPGPFNRGQAIPTEHRHTPACAGRNRKRSPHRASDLVLVLSNSVRRVR
jgi:hypothetical protein